MAARKVHASLLVAQIPSPGLASTASAVLLTTREAAHERPVGMMRKINTVHSITAPSHSLCAVRAPRGDRTEKEGLIDLAAINNARFFTEVPSGVNEVGLTQRSKSM
jgi:hypothetical protein